MEKKSYEQATARIEEIINALEGGELPLEESMKLYEEGIRLVRFCGGELEKAEGKIRILKEEADGKRQFADFLPEDK